MRQLSSSHSYEELRGVVVDVLLKRENVRQAPTHYQYLVSGVAEVLVRRGSPATDMPHTSGPNEVLHQRDVELVRDVFWDLFRQGYVVLGGHDPNEQFRLSTFAEQTLNSHSPYRFHDTNSFISMVRKEVPDISPEAIVYLSSTTRPSGLFPVAETNEGACVLDRRVLPRGHGPEIHRLCLGAPETGNRLEPV